MKIRRYSPTAPRYRPECTRRPRHWAAAPGIYQPDILKDAARIYLRRVRTDELTGDPQQPGHFEYFAGMPYAGAALWSVRELDAVPVFGEPTGPPWGVRHWGHRLCTHHSGAICSRPGTMHRSAGSVFSKPRHPRGPWATLAYYEDWGGLNETAGEGTGLGLPTQWMSADGRSLWMTFSRENRGADNEFDSLNLTRATPDKN
jgi:hypothetical protein